MLIHEFNRLWGKVVSKQSTVQAVNYWEHEPDPLSVLGSIGGGSGGTAILFGAGASEYNCPCPKFLGTPTHGL